MFLRLLRAVAKLKWDFILYRLNVTQLVTLLLDSELVSVLCHFGNFGCGDGGWTPVMKMNGSKVKHVYLATRVGKNVLQLNTGLLLSPVIFHHPNLRIQPFLLAPRRWRCFARRKVCASATEIPCWWRKNCPDSGQELWLVEIVVTLFYMLFTNDRQRQKVTKAKCKRGCKRGWIRHYKTVNIPGIYSSLEKASEFCWSSFAIENKTLP